MGEPAPAVIFMHIPKTAGMSLFAALCTRFGPRVADLYSENLAAPAAAAQILRDPRYDVLAGHFCFGVHAWMTRPACYFAVVRDPVRRVISLYYFLRPFREAIVRWCSQQQQSFAEAIANRQVSEFHGDFAPWFAGEDTLATFVDCPSADLDNSMVRRFSGLGPTPGPCPESALAQAQENIARCFSVVGLTEQYPQTLELLRRTFDWPWLQERRANASRGRRPDADLPARLRQRIEEMNPLDRALYTWIAERFTRHAAAPTPPIVVPGAGRTDVEALPLGKATGRPALLPVLRYLHGGDPAEPELGGPFVMPPIA